MSFIIGFIIGMVSMDYLYFAKTTNKNILSLNTLIDYTYFIKKLFITIKENLKKIRN